MILNSHLFAQSETVLRCPVRSASSISETWHRAFDTFVQFDENSEWRVPHNSAANGIPTPVSCEELLPDIRLQLFDSEREPMVVGVDIQNHGFHPLALLQHFGRMFDAARRDVGNVNKTIDSFFDFDKRAEIRQISHAAGDHGADRVSLCQRAPGIGLRLLETERDAAIVHVDIEDDGFDILCQAEAASKDASRACSTTFPRHE